MPYCTIEEAWGSKHSASTKSDKSSSSKQKYRTLDGDTSNGQLNYAPFDTRIDTTRGYELLPEHSESRKRSTNMTSTPEVQSFRQILDDKPCASDSARVKSALASKKKDVKTDVSVMQRLEEQIVELRQENAKMQALIKKLRGPSTVEPFTHDGVGASYKRGSTLDAPLSNDNLFDLILFISAGIFILFLLDMIASTIRRF